MLRGAVALLFLLGIPWIFSGFGAIDPGNMNGMKVFEIVCEVISVSYVDVCKNVTTHQTLMVLTMLISSYRFDIDCLR